MVFRVDPLLEEYSCEKRCHGEIDAGRVKIKNRAKAAPEKSSEHPGDLIEQSYKEPVSAGIHIVRAIILAEHGIGFIAKGII